MGPRFFKRGESIPSPLASGKRTSFNGATLLQAWRGEYTLILPQKRGTSFNGATLLQAWREVDSGQREKDSNRLQWGHASSSVERFDTATLQRNRNTAS